MKNNFNKDYMAKMLERCYSASGLSKVPQWSLDYTSMTDGSWEPIIEALHEWEGLGILYLIKDPQKSSKNEICVELRSFFGGNSFPDNWIRD